MATAKIVLRKKKNTDGTFPLALRITKDRKSSYVYLGYRCQEKDWDATAQRVRKSHPNAQRLNTFLMQTLADAGNVMLDFDMQRKQSSAKTLKKKIKPTGESMFFARAALYLDRMKEAGNYNCWSPETSRVRLFKEFVLGTEAIEDELPKRKGLRKHPPCAGVLPGTDVPFQHIDVALLTQFKIYLKAQRKISDRTIANYLITIQTIFSHAIKEGVLDEKCFPFGKDKIRIKLPKSQKVGLTKDDVERLETITLIDPLHAAARDLWLTSFYFAGMRAGDVLQMKWSDIREGRLYYTMGKNNKPVSLKVPDKAKEILERYKADQTGAEDDVFPFLKDLPDTLDTFTRKQRISKKKKKCDRLLREHIAPAAKITGKLSLHIARHTFATLAGDKIPIQMLQKLYRHSDIKTTLGYQANFINQDADEALDRVVGGS